MNSRELVELMMQNSDVYAYYDTTNRYRLCKIQLVGKRRCQLVYKNSIVFWSKNVNIVQAFANVDKPSVKDVK